MNEDKNKTDFRLHFYTVKSLSMIFETFKRTYGEQFADSYLQELILMWNKKILRQTKH